MQNANAIYKDRHLSSWLTTPSALFLLTAIFVVSTVVAIAILVVVILSNANSDFRLIIGAVVGLATAISGFLFNSAIKLHADIRKTTADFLETSHSSEDFKKAQAVCGRYLRDNGPTDPEAAENLLQGSREQRAGEVELLAAIVYVGNYFERLAIRVRHGEMTEDLLKDFYQHILIRYFDGFGYVISALRYPGQPTVAARPATFQRAEELAWRWGWTEKVSNQSSP